MMSVRPRHIMIHLTPVVKDLELEKFGLVYIDWTRSRSRDARRQRARFIFGAT
jgi:hypothetical protein